MPSSLSTWRKRIYLTRPCCCGAFYRMKTTTTKPPKELYDIISSREWKKFCNQINFRLLPFNFTRNIGTLMLVAFIAIFLSIPCFGITVVNLGLDPVQFVWIWGLPASAIVLLVGSVVLRECCGVGKTSRAIDNICRTASNKYSHQGIVFRLHDYHVDGNICGEPVQINVMTIDIEIKTQQQQLEGEEEGEEDSFFTDPVLRAAAARARAQANDPNHHRNHQDGTGGTIIPITTVIGTPEPLPTANAIPIIRLDDDNDLDIEANNNIPSATMACAVVADDDDEAPSPPPAAAGAGATPICEEADDLDVEANIPSIQNVAAAASGNKTSAAAKPDHHQNKQKTEPSFNWSNYAEQSSTTNNKKSSNNQHQQKKKKAAPTKKKQQQKKQRPSLESMSVPRNGNSKGKKQRQLPDNVKRSTKKKPENKTSSRKSDNNNSGRGNDDERSTVRQRLQELNAIKDMLTQQEYEDKRAEILASI